MITLDPLSEYADPRLYVALATGERALAAISAALRACRSPVLLAGPTGIGKTHLLMVLAERERESFQRVRLARSIDSTPTEVATWLLQFLFGKSAPNAAAAKIGLLEELRPFRDAPILLLVDELQRTPEATVRELADLARAYTPSLAVVVAGTTGSELDALTAALAPELTVTLPESLPEVEIEALYESILAHPGLSPRLPHRITSDARREILQAAAGLPRRLKHDLARRDLPSPTPARRIPPAELPPWEKVPADRPAVAEPITRLPSVTNALQVPPAELPPWAKVRSEKASAARRATKPATGRLKRALPNAIRGLRRAVGRAATQLARPFLVAGRGARALVTQIARVCVVVSRVPRSIGSAARAFASVLRRRSSALSRAAIDASSRAGSSLAKPLSSAARATKSVCERALASALAVPPAVGVALRRFAGGLRRRSSAFSRAAIDASSRAGSSLAKPLSSAARATKSLLERALASALAVPPAVEVAARALSHQLTTRLRRAVTATGHSIRAWHTAFRTTLARVKARLDAAGRTVATSVNHAGASLIRSSTEIAQRTGVQSIASAHAIGARLSTGIGATARRTDARIRDAARSVSRSAPAATGRMRMRLANAAGLARNGRSALRAKTTAAVSATALLAVALFSISQYESVVRDRPTLESTALADPPGADLSSRAVNVQVNARPWAHVRINGLDVGPTPLSRQLVPGVYELEADFPDGRKIQRKIDITTERRFFSLP